MPCPGGKRCRWRAAGVLTFAVLWNVAAGAVASCLSGFVRDGVGRPVVGGDLDFFGYDTGIKQATSSDGTDAFGFYSVCVPPGLYKVTFAPAPGTRLLGKELAPIDLRSDLGLELDVVLEPGRVVAGVVRTADGTPLGGVDVDVDRMTGGRMFTPNDRSATGSGVYAVVVPEGSYRFRFTPPRGARWLGLQLDSVTISADQALDVTLSPGVLLYGHVCDAMGSPLRDIELDLRRREDGVRILLMNKATGTNGDYETAVPRGSFEVRFDPPPGSRAVASRIDSLAIGEDTRLDLVLENGRLVTAVACDSAGAPLAGVELDVVQESTGQKLYLPRDETDAKGRLGLALRPDTYTFRFDPPSDSGLERVVLRGIAVTRDTTLSAGLPAEGWRHLSGRVVDAAGEGVAGALLHAVSVPGGDVVGAPFASTAASGSFDLALPRGLVELRVAPPRGRRLLGRRLPPLLVEGDVALGDVVLEAGFLFTARVTNAANAPIGDATLRLVAALAGPEAYIPEERTGADGIAIAALAPGRYDATVIPAGGPELSRLTLAGIEVHADTTVAFVLPGPEERGPRLASFLSLAPNPFAGAIEIGVRVRAPVAVSIDLYDVAGRHIRRLAQGDRPASNFTCEWDGKRANGAPAPAGLYFVRLQAASTTETRKILLVR